MNTTEAVATLIRSGMTQAVIAHEIGVSQPMVCRYLAGGQPTYEIGLQLVSMGRKAEAKMKRREREQV